MHGFCFCSNFVYIFCFFFFVKIQQKEFIFAHSSINSCFFHFISKFTFWQFFKIDQREDWGERKYYTLVLNWAWKPKKLPKQIFSNFSAFQPQLRIRVFNFFAAQICEIKITIFTLENTVIQKNFYHSITIFQTVLCSDCIFFALNKTVLIFKFPSNASNYLVNFGIGVILIHFLGVNWVFWNLWNNTFVMFRLVFAKRVTISG